MKTTKRIRLSVALPILAILSLILATMIINAATATPVIHSFDQLNDEEHVSDSHEGITDRSTLELDFRSKQLLGLETLGVNTAHYPRLKKMSDGRYILIYNSARTGPDVMYVTSSDLRTWSEPKTLFLSNDTYEYATADAVVLENGDIVACVAIRAKAWGTYVTDMSSDGISIKRSKDNGATWSEEKRVYNGLAWEPSIIQLDSGEIQIYFTHTAPYIYMYGYYDELRSTGSAMVRSVDGGVTWTPNVSEDNVNPSDPFAAWRVMQQIIGTMDLTEKSTGNIVTVPMLNDQMPVAIQLNNGSIALVAESYLHFENHPVNGGKYQISIGFSHDNWAKPLGIHEEGPSDKLLNVDRGAGPYISQFPSGEVIVSHTNTSSHLEYKIFDTTGHSYVQDFSFDPGTKNLWSSSEVISSHKIAMLVDDGNDTEAVETTGIFQISYTEHALNHNITAKRQKTTLDGNNDDWKKNTEALFIGSLSQAQTSVRSAYDDTYVYFLVEVLDKYLSSSDKVELCLSPSLTSTTSYNITVGPNGLVSKTYSYTVDVSKYVGGSIGTDSNTDTGYMVEIRLKKSDLSKIGFADSMYVLPKLYNTDGSTTFSFDSISGASITASGKKLCPKITYNGINKLDTVYVSDSGNDNAYGDTTANAVKTLARASAMLNENGTIIISGTLTLNSDVHLRSDASKITIKGLNGSEKINCGFDVYLYTDVSIDNVNLNVTASNKFIYARYNDLIIGKNVGCTKTSTTSFGIIGGYFADNAKYTYASLCSNKDCYIEINSGVWRYVRGGNRRSGTSAPLGHYSGNTTMVVNGGIFEAPTTGTGDDVSSPTGMNSSSGNNVMIVAGGSFAGSIYALSRSGGIVTTADGYTSSPNYSGSAKVIYVRGTVTGKIKAEQVLGYPTSNIVFNSSTVLSSEYSYGNQSVFNNGFDSAYCFGGYAIDSSEAPINVEINGVNVDARYYNGKIFLPVASSSEKDLAVVYYQDENDVYLIDPVNVSYTDLGLTDAFPTYKGTAIRIMGTAGLRFKSSIDMSSIPSSVNVTEIGTIAAFAKNVTSSNPLNEFSDKIGTSIAFNSDMLIENWYEEKENGEKIFTAVLVNFSENEYSQNVACRPYVKFTYNGNEYTLYGQCVTRSILGVARQCDGVDSASPFVQSILSTYLGSDNNLDHSFFEQ